MHLFGGLPLLLLTAALSACGTTTNVHIERETEQPSFVEAGNDFAFRFLRQIERNEPGDWFVSPVSMQFLLGMLLSGAQDGTADEIARVLGYGADEIDAANAYARAMLDSLPLRDPKTKLTLANAIFLNEQAKLKPSYVQQMDAYYDATVENLDFRNGTASLKRINGWCSEKTNGLIPGVLDKVEPEMLAYLLNALYFKGSWQDAFPAKRTEEKPFHREQGGDTPVKMMQQTERFRYGEHALCRCVRLPYGNGAFSMIVLLPAGGRTVGELAAALDADSWNEICAGQYSVKVDLWLPRFETKYHVKLNDILSEMGMPRAFKKGKADFKAMSDRADYLDFVQQDAVIKVDETGSEAAAISSAGMMMTTAVGQPPRIVEFHADRPFLYVITEAKSGAILFAGKYTGK